MTGKFYITTSIAYANSEPHLGFALELVQADVVARWNRLKGKKVFFLTGTDEHGIKIYKKAIDKNIGPQKFVDKISGKYKELIRKLNISNNNFIRTTDREKHWKGVFKLWELLKEKGDLYKKRYTGHYCSGCERFLSKKELIKGKCPFHPNIKIEKVSEENYFFKLSRYSNKIKNLIEEDKIEIFPQQWKNDFLGFAKEGLKDVSFSREKANLPWGIPVPNDETQVMYVWCDALANYLTGIGFPEKRYQEFWPADVHLVGKDILRFHAGIWPGMLLSAGLELPKKINVHGFITSQGKKMSKSQGNVVEPLKLLEKYNEDTLRYYLCRDFVFGEDGDFSEEVMIERHNNELADKLGNLVSRTLGLIEKSGIEASKNNYLVKKINIDKISRFLEKFQFDKALSEIFRSVDRCNKYIQDKKPWETKDKKILYELASAIKTISILLWPFMPATIEKIAELFNFEISLDEIKKPFYINNKLKLNQNRILFKKISK